MKREKSEEVKGSQDILKRIISLKLGNVYTLEGKTEQKLGRDSINPKQIHWTCGFTGPKIWLETIVRPQ